MKKIKSFRLFETSKVDYERRHNRFEVLNKVKEDIEGIIYELNEYDLTIQPIQLNNVDRFGRDCDDFNSTFYSDDNGNGIMISVGSMTKPLREDEQKSNSELFMRFTRLLKDYLDYVCIGDDRIGMRSNSLCINYTIDLRGYLKKLGYS